MVNCQLLFSKYMIRCVPRITINHYHCLHGVQRAENPFYFSPIPWGWGIAPPAHRPRPIDERDYLCWFAPFVRVGRQQVVVQIRFYGVSCFTHDCILRLQGWLLRICLLAGNRGPSAARKTVFFIIALFLWRKDTQRPSLRMRHTER